MTATPSVVVVGGGAVGLCTAFELTELGVTDVTVIEREQVASGSSGLSVGIVETQYLDPLAIAIRVYSMEFFARLEREAGLQVTRNGYLRLAHDSADMDVFAASIVVQSELGVTHPRLLDRGDVERLVPDMACSDLVACSARMTATSTAICTAPSWRTCCATGEPACCRRPAS